MFERVVRRYAACGHAARGFAAGKLRRDPVHRDVLEAAARIGGFGEVVDVGCGAGQMAVALLEAGLARVVLGLDRAAAQLERASRAGQGLALGVRAQDLARDPTIPDADAVLVIDALYQLDPAAQERLLRSTARAARKTLLIRTLDAERGWRSTLTMAFERFCRMLAPGSGRHVCPPPVAALVRKLQDYDFDVEVAPCWRGTPFANVLLIARRRGQPEF